MLDFQVPRITSETVEENRGSFTVEPLDRGFGYTFGNSLRRVLLASLAGAAVTSVRIEGASGVAGVSPSPIRNANPPATRSTRKPEPASTKSNSVAAANPQAGAAPNERIVSSRRVQALPSAGRRERAPPDSLARPARTRSVRSWPAADAG